MRKTNFSVKQRPRESSERLIRRFIKKAKKEKIVEIFRDKQRYEKPSVRKKIKSKKAQRQRERDLAKLKKKQNRANNRN
jgi:ribosomal protein S21